MYDAIFAKLLSHIPAVKLRITPSCTSLVLRRLFHCQTVVCSQKQRHLLKKLAEQRSLYLKNMAQVLPQVEEQLAPLRALVKEQGDEVRRLKESGATKIDVAKAVNELKARKKKLEDTEIALCPKEDIIDRLKLEELLRRRFFYVQAFEIHGGVTGLYDFGPMGCALKSNFLNVWRSHFVLEESMLEIDSCVLTPEIVLKASGHVERFADYMVKDLETGECFRADHLIKGHLEKLSKEKGVAREALDKMETVLAQLDGFSREDMAACISEYNMKSPLTGNDITEPIPFNLMFPTSIGPSGALKGFLRPETAQGIFVNFKRLLEFNQGRLPLAAAQIGSAFRNEISPRQGLIRVREFTMAEIEHFVDPDNKDHPKFAKVADTVMTLLSASDQMSGTAASQMTVGDAVQRGLIANQSLGYYMARTYQYLMKVGVHRNKVRFRQHMANEMAHYACDCWDAECFTTYGWIECVGNADRSCYDLEHHQLATGVRMTAEKPLPAPVTVDAVECLPNKQLIGKTYKADGKTILQLLKELSVSESESIERQLADNGETTVKSGDKEFKLSKDMITVKRVQKQIHVKEFTPSVIEPSFGIGRIIYAVLEHNFRCRDGDEMRQYLSFPPLVAPTKCSVLPLSAKDELKALAANVCEELVRCDVAHRVDQSSGTIGRRYARTDEIGIPFGITVDFDSLTEPHTVTVRERDTMAQIRVPLSDVGHLLQQLSTARMTWSAAVDKYPKFDQQETTS